MTVVVSDVTSLFITTMDAVKLNQCAVDEIQPLIHDLLKVLNESDDHDVNYDKGVLFFVLKEAYRIIGDSLITIQNG